MPGAAGRRSACTRLGFDTQRWWRSIVTLLRRFALDLPLSILGMTSIITVTQLLIRVTDELSMGFIGQFQDDVSQFGTVVASLQQMTGGPASALVVFVLGVATVLAGLVLVAELVIRSSLIYIVVALSPLVLAARLWPATRGATRRLLDLLGALILSKLVIAIADDHPMWRSGVRADLDGHFEIVGEADDADGAIALVASTSPDVLLCDLQMPGGGLKVVRACADRTRIIMLTVSEAERDVLDAVAAGAVGYLAKSLAAEDLRAAIATAAEGEAVFSPGLALLVMKEFRRISAPDGGPIALTPREREVLQHVARGRTYRQVGADLFISEKTVETHVRNILGKLHLNRREELARYAADHDLT